MFIAKLILFNLLKIHLIFKKNRNHLKKRILIKMELMMKKLHLVLNSDLKEKT
jgi:hypothetical protein